MLVHVLRLFTILACSTALGQIPAPQAFFGFSMGENFKLASWSQIHGYLEAVDQASDRVLVREAGRTTLDRPFLIVEVSSPANLARRDELMAMQRDIAGGLRGGAEAAARTLQSARGVVYLSCNLHSTEIASSLMVPELVYALATRDDPHTLEILENCVLVIAPSANPDGVDIVKNWYDLNLGTPWEGSSPPELYHHYIGHDNNRDWFMLSQVETRIATRILYKEWLPAIVYDVHQMGSSGARYFVPPFSDPVNPNLDPLLQRTLGLYGTFMARELSRAGKTGVVQGVTFDNWWNGGARNVPYRHNMVGILSEAASPRLASPIFQRLGDLKGHGNELPEYKRQTNFPDPWPGGWWRLRDVIDYELISVDAVLTLTARLRQEINRDYAELARRATLEGERGPTTAWILPHDQPDLPAVRRCVQNLLDTGVEVHAASASFQAGGATYPAGSFVVFAAQPYRAHVKDLLERQEYPEIKASTQGDVIKPYDNAGWTMPLQFGIRCVALGGPLAQDAAAAARKSGALALITELPALARLLPDAPQVLVRPTTNDAFTFVNRLLERGIGVRRVPEQSSAVGDRGTFVLDRPAGADWEACIAGLLPEVAAAAETPVGSRTLARPRVGIYQPWTTSMDEGWTRYVLERHGFSLRVLHDAEMRTLDLGNEIDALVIASMSEATLMKGAGPADAPPAYQGGLGDEGREAIRTFVRAGGTLLTFGASCGFGAKLAGIELQDETDPEAPKISKEEKDARMHLSCPGSILRATFEPGIAQAAGLASSWPIFYSQHAVWPAGAEGALARLDSGDPLLSGYLRRPEVIAGKAVLVRRSVDRGVVWLFGFRPQNRAQTLGTFRLIFSALVDSAAR
jgi:hypothetical protein